MPHARPPTLAAHDSRRGLATMLLGCLVPLVGCALHPGHTIQPYADTPSAAHALEDRAAAECRTRRSGARPPYSFTTDGCSFWPDGTWAGCCVEHDIAYWCGGTHSERMVADAALQDCVRRDTHDPVLSSVMRVGVLLGGGQLMPTAFRWGYGWPYPFAGP
ncbi:MAG: hypothetical protein KIT14_11400 [bacterium]|nr:hypothetical protein [bacterium]